MSTISNPLPLYCASRVRHQIMNPDDATIDRSTLYDASKAKDSWIVMSIDLRRCRIVRIDTRDGVPSDEWFYEASGHIRGEGTFTLDNAYSWRSVEFGVNVAQSFTIENWQHWYDFQSSIGGEPFGGSIRAMDPNGSVTDFALADYVERDVTLLRVSSQLKTTNTTH